MTDHKTGTREQWLAARLELLEAEKALTRRSDELARQRRELPWVRQRRELPWVPVEKEYPLQTEDGARTLAELFDRRSQKLLPGTAAVDTPLALMIVGLGIWIVLAPSSVPGLTRRCDTSPARWTGQAGETTGKGETRQ